MHLFKEFDSVGKILFSQHLISASAGNLSIRKGDNIYITASGSILGDLNLSDIIRLPLSGRWLQDYGNIFSKPPSMEMIVHKSIYEKTPHKAIVHAHPPTAIAISFNTGRIVPQDSEGLLYFKEVPVVHFEIEIASKEVAEVIPSLLNKCPVVVVRRHGVFAASDTLLKACSLVTTLEFSSQILYKKKIFENYHKIS